MREGLYMKELRYVSLMRISIIIAHNESKLLNYFVVRFSCCTKERDSRETLPCMNVDYAPPCDKYIRTLALMQFHKL